TFDVSVSDGHGGVTTQLVTVNWTPAVIQGGDSDDTLVVNDYAFTLLGGVGNDTLISEGEANLLDGEAGDDTALHTGDMSTVLGGIGADYLSVDGLSNIVDGGVGDDILRASGGANALFGGADADDVKAYEGADGSVLDGGTGDDYVRTYANDGTLFGGDGNDEVRDWGGINNTLHGGIGDDYMRMYGQNGAMFGDAGMDDMKTYGDNNTLDGGDGDDVLADQGLDNHLIGGAGTDMAVFSSGLLDVSITRGETGSAIVVGPNGTTTLSGIESVRFADGDIYLDRNNAPIVAADVRSAAEDSPLTFAAADLLTNDRDLEGDALSVVAVGGAVNGSVSLNGDGTITFTPSPDFNGVASFDCTVSDGNGGIATNTVTVDVAAVNDAPVAQADTVTTAEDVVLTIRAAELLTNDSDIEGDSLSIQSVSNAAGGSVALDGEGNVVFSPSAGFNGVATFDYTVSDAHGATQVQTVAVNVLAASTINDTLGGLAGRSMVFSVADLLGNDGGAGATLTSIGAAVHGAVTLDVSGNIIFTSEENYSGPAFFTYSASSDTGAYSRNVYVDVAPITAGPNQTVAVPTGDSRVNATTTGDQNYMSVASLGSGGYVTVWQSGTTTSADIFGRLYSADGTALATEFKINTYVTNGQTQADVTGLANGFVVVWQSAGQDSGTTGIYAQRYSTTGTRLGSEVRVNTTVTDTQSNPTVISLAGGGYVVAWESNLQDGSGWGVYGKRYSMDGVAQGGEFAINTSTSNRQDKVTLCPLGDGFLAVWQSYLQDGSGDGVYAQRFSANGTKVGGEFRVNVTTSLSQGYPVAAQLADGSFVVSWESAMNSIYARHFAVDASPLGGEFRVDGSGGTQARYPSIVATQDGGYVIGWQANPDATYIFDVFAKAFSSDDVGGQDVLVSTYRTDAQRYIDLAMLQSGKVVAGWDSVGQDGSGAGSYTKMLSVSSLVTGTSIDDGLIGSAKANTVMAGSGNDIIQAGAGNDCIQGQEGNDTIVAGSGADVISFNVGDGVDVVQNFGSSLDGDALSFSGVDQFKLWFSHAENDLAINVIGTTDVVLIDDWYVGTDNRVSTITVGSSQISAGSVENLVSAMAAFALPPAGQTELTAEQHQQLDPVIAANWQSLLYRPAYEMTFSIHG
ncbi:MAG: cadherin-like domain-containing protein, partial [Alphaproteobacteria bacterium]|nr:cadherin-like domain-containing protein [Alphaproteobacteria bacterium]